MANLRIESEDNYGLEFIIFFKLSGVLFDWNMGEFSIVKNKYYKSLFVAVLLED